MNLSVIIVAAGKGLRMGAELPKQFLSFYSTPILMLTIGKFHETLPYAEIIVALGADYVEFWKELCRKHNFMVPHRIVVGGDTRVESV
ncbi:MAG: 2-C-methyl-D-erythritol 4-phosphate cytidylyltransferase, partial [Rikenellaceae bacterium]